MQSVDGEHHEKAVELLKAAQGSVKLVVRYTPKVLEEMEARFEKMRSARRRQQHTSYSWVSHSFSSSWSLGAGPISTSWTTNATMAAAGSGCGVLQLACEWSKPGLGLWHSELPFCFRKWKKVQYCDYITYDLLIFVLSLSTVHWSQGADELNASIRPSVQLFLPFSSCRQPGTLNR